MVILEEIKSQPKRYCTTPGCENRHKAKGLCSSCYFAIYKKKNFDRIARMQKEYKKNNARKINYQARKRYKKKRNIKQCTKCSADTDNALCSKCMESRQNYNVDDATGWTPKKMAETQKKAWWI